MLTIQPPFIREYFSTTNLPLPKHIFRSFFLSWEDALWHLLQVYRLPNGAVILVPEFFCGNVMDHMEDHGLKVVTYRIDRYLQPIYTHFVAQLHQLQPSVVVIFHSVGITNPLMKRSTQWISSLIDECLLIEDCVHRIINPTTITFSTARHFLIDSLRKVVPIQGSNVYSPTQLPPIPLATNVATLRYRLGVHAWWSMMQFCLVLAYYTKISGWRKRLNSVAEWAMIHGYKLIGAISLPSVGNSVLRRLADHIDIEAVEKTKTWQANRYMEGVKKLLVSGDFWLPRMEVRDYENLRGFPLIMCLTIADRFLACMREAGIILRFELDDSPWSEKQKIVYLPMGLHIHKKDIAFVLNQLNRFSRT